MPIPDSPMPMRKNVDWRWREYWTSRPDCAIARTARAGAAGHIDVFPNSRNVIPGKVVVPQSTSRPDRVITDMEAFAHRRSGNRGRHGLEIEFESWRSTRNAWLWCCAPRR
jgi:N-carbamoyl-L-amino-acid hydrolase